MIGRTIKSRPARPWGAILLLCVGLAAAAAGPFIGTTLPTIAAALPLALGASFLIVGREREFSATFTALGMEVDDPPGSIRYDQIRGVWADGRAHDPSTFHKSSCVIHVDHEEGLLRIPGRLDHPSREVYAFLAGRVPARGGRDVNPALAEYLEREESQFGPDQVWTYTLAKGRRRGFGYPRLRIFGVGLLLAAAAWMAAGFSGLADVAWGIAGVVAAVSGGLCCLASYSESALHFHLGRGLKNSSLVIGPQGMAMVQGEIQGAVRWPEVLEIRYAPKHFALTSFSHNSAGLAFIRLRVKGAEIRILDIYDRPLYVIHNQIVACSRQVGNRGGDPVC